MRKLLFPKDTQAHCGFCGDLIFVFNIDIYHGDKSNVSQIYPDKGQAPWQNGQEMICRNCGAHLNQYLMKFKGPKQ